jgi:hypothetical protein
MRKNILFLLHQLLHAQIEGMEALTHKTMSDNKAFNTFHELKTENNNDV